MSKKLGVIYDFKRTMNPDEFAIATSNGLHFCTIAHEDTAFRINFNEKEKYFENQVIISFVEVNPQVIIGSVWGSKCLQMIDRSQGQVIKKFHDISEVRNNNQVFRSIGFHDYYFPYLFVKDMDKISIVNL